MYSEDIYNEHILRERINDELSAQNRSDISIYNIVIFNSTGNVKVEFNKNIKGIEFDIDGHFSKSFNKSEQMIKYEISVCEDYFIVEDFLALYAIKLSINNFVELEY